MSTTTERPRQRPPMDPRIKARRIEVTREQGRRRLHVLLAAGLVGGVMAGAIATVRSPLLDVDRVVVEGAARTPADVVVAAAAIDQGAAMVALDLGRASRAVKALPWVAAASVERRWPGTVIVRIRERHPAITVPDGVGGWVLADRPGRILAAVEAPTPDAPVVLGLTRPGPPGTTLDPRGRGAVAAVTALAPEVRNLLVAVEVDAAGHLVLKLRAGRKPVPTAVRLGSPNQLDDKARALATVLARVDVTRIAVLDVRVPGAPVLTRR